MPNLFGSSIPQCWSQIHVSIIQTTGLVDWLQFVATSVHSSKYILAFFSQSKKAEMDCKSESSPNVYIAWQVIRAAFCEKHYTDLTNIFTVLVKVHELSESYRDGLSAEGGLEHSKGKTTNGRPPTLRWGSLPSSQLQRKAGTESQITISLNSVLYVVSCFRKFFMAYSQTKGVKSFYHCCNG